jgi:SET domain-containing protein
VEDAACRRGVGALANHRAHSTANARLSFLRTTGRFRLVAKKPIRNGKEIFVDYGRQYRHREPTTHQTTRVRR